MTYKDTAVLKAQSSNIQGAIIRKLYHEIASQTTASLILTEKHVAISSVRHKLIVTEFLYTGQSRVLY